MDKKLELREVDGFPNYYVGNDGNLYSDKQPSKAKKYPNGVYPIVPKLHNRGYLEYGLFGADGKRIWKLIHILVAESFLGEKPTEKHEVHHINNIKTDNRPENLQWVTRSENIYHSFHTHGRNNSVRPIYYNGKVYISIKGCAEENGLNQYSLNTSLSKMRTNGKTETKHKGKVLKYATNQKISAICVLSDLEILQKD